jgi:transcriptional regulator with XRE-family HTH domain
MKRERVKLRCFGKNLKTLRKQYVEYQTDDKGTYYENVGLSQKDLAEQLNVSHDTVKNWEQGFNYPTVKELIEIADFLGCSIDVLFSRGIYGKISTAASNNISRWADDTGSIKTVSDLLEDENIISEIVKLASRKYPPVKKTVDFNNVLFSTDSGVYGTDYMKQYDRKRLHDMIDAFLDSENGQLMR